MKSVLSKCIGIILLIPISFFYSYASNPGARSGALAGANVSLQDEYAVFNNIAGIARFKLISTLASCEHRFGLGGLSSISAGALIPLRYGVTSVDITRFGNSIYNESSIGWGFAHQIQNIGIGIKASYIQYHIDEYGTKGTVALEFGGIAALTKSITFGAHIYNFNQARISRQTKEKIPVIMKAGLSFRLMEKVLLLTEVEKNELFPVRFKVGLEYSIIQNLFLRTGISTQPIRSTFGMGLNLKNFKIDYALGSYSRVGQVHHLSLVYNISKNK